MRGSRSYRFSAFAAAGLIAAAGVAACSSGSSGSTAQASGTSQRPELTSITVDSLDTPDTMEIWLAEQDGFFKQQGIDDVNLTLVSTAAAAEPGLLSHTVDFALENYVGAFEEQAANPSLGLRIVADDQQQGPNTGVILVAKNSGIKSVADLRGKTIAFPSPVFALGTLELDEQLQGYGIGPHSYTVVPLGFPDMIGPLAKGVVSAAYSIQPFITIMEASIGAHPLVDLNTGATLNFPASGWATTASFAKQNPKTVAAFQRAVGKAAQICASNPALVRKLLPKYIKTLSPQIANVMALQTFVTTLSTTRLQRVATVMGQFGVIPKNFSVAPLIIPLPPGA